MSFLLAPSFLAVEEFGFFQLTDTCEILLINTLLCRKLHLSFSSSSLEGFGSGAQGQAL